jgi:hypothetical protein
VSRLYREAEDLCRVWTLALDEELVHTGASERMSASDELYATEGAVLGRFSPPARRRSGWNWPSWCGRRRS